MRKAPDIEISERQYDCQFLCAGYDTLEESASVYIFERTWDSLEKGKAYAREHNTGRNQPYTTLLGDMEFQIAPHGGNGVTFILTNPQCTIAIRPASVEYNVSVTYRSRFLWEHGAEKARKLIWDKLLEEMKPRPIKGQSEEAAPEEWRKISRADYAFDFHAPEMTQEISADMIERVICHSSSKWRWDFKVKGEEGEHDGYTMGRSGRIQTLTVGKKSSLQIQLYKKSDEITESSQKTWMYKLYEQAGAQPNEEGKHDDIWRIELRFGREYLAARGIDTFEYFDFHREKLLCEALKTRRLTDRTADSNRRRWPVHPMWGQAITMAGHAMIMLRLDGHREQAASKMQEKIIQDIKAAYRRFCVLENGGSEYDWVTVHNLHQQIFATIEEDENHEDKMKEYGERFKYVHEPI